MKFQTLTLHNVGVYVDRQSIDLTTTPHKPVVLIGGLNGCGKTTLLDSLQLCLYGNRARCAGRGSLGYEAYLAELISKRARPSDGASIELTFNVVVDGEDRRYRVVRAWKQAGQGVREFVSVFVGGRIDPTLSQTWADHVEDLLPLELSALFLFDGEKVKDLADPATASTVIRTAVNSLLGVGALDQLRTDLTALRRRQRAPEEDATLRTHIDHLLGQLQQLERDRDALTQKRAATGSDRTSAAAELEKAERAFASAGGELYDKRVELESQHRSIRDSMTRTQEQLRDIAEGPLPLALLGEPAARLAGLAEQSTKAETTSGLLDVLCERDEWLISILPKGSRDEIRVQLTSNRTTLAAEAEYEGPPLSSDTTVRLSAAESAISDARKRATVAIADYRDLTEQADALERSLGQIPDEDRIAAAQQSRHDASLRLAGIDGQLEVIDGDLSQLAESEATIQGQLAVAEATRREQLAEGDYVRRMIDSIERVKTTLEQLKTRQVQAHVHKVEVAALDSFTRLMRKQGLVADLRIDPETFTVRLRDSHGHQVRPGSLSSGESQILAISLLWGLARVAGRPVPTVVDTPLGRLDSANRRLLVEKYFPQASSQVLLLSTDEEIDAGLYPLLSPTVSRSYLLDHDDKAAATTIRPGYWWDQEGKAS